LDISIKSMVHTANRPTKDMRRGDSWPIRYATARAAMLKISILWCVQGQECTRGMLGHVQLMLSHGL
jgi:hypothetical protein